ncbi:MAG: biotin--[acetyl-CoA-carboxylase] ligase [Cellulomonadaceae bacterium]|jgi:BirA family biotin operon repressor/biotin-[acetyl-CoA-carboxylase] ligase|nr:biotin--[acetyl-CoA-carboxylase] ligase [Cellulomonadaceae bacterium]
MSFAPLDAAEPATAAELATAAESADIADPLDAARLAAALTGWDVTVVAQCPSTNAALARQAGTGLRCNPPAALVAEHQTAGQGRAGRTWETPPGAAITASALLAPDVPPLALGWVSLLAGIASCRALAQVSGVDARLKWPNDVLLPADTPVEGLGHWRKLCGILAQVVPGVGVVVGIGVNVSQTADQLPVPTATSLALADASSLNRTDILIALLTELQAVIGQWESSGAPDSLLDDYAALCSTIGQEVRVDLAADGGSLTGRARGIGDDGALIVASDDGAGRTALHYVAAGDVHHLRLAQ